MIQSNSPHFSTLIGEPEENFYQLGLSHRQEALQVLQQMHQVFKSKVKALDWLADTGLNQWGKTKLRNKNLFTRLISSYAEGLNISAGQYLATLLIPEASSGLKGVFPQLPFGCSSAFIHDEAQKLWHFRILDFPLVSAFDRHEHILHYQFKGWPDLYSFTSKGLALPGVTLISPGVWTLALHQKMTQSLAWSGTSIFQIILEFSQNVQTLQEALDFLKKQTPITTWCFNLSFNSGEHLSVDIGPQGIFQTNFQTDRLTNHLIDPDLPAGQEFLPRGFESYCNLRLQSLKSAKTKELKAEQIYQSFLAPSSKETSGLHFTPSTLQAVMMSAHSSEVYWLEGMAPKNGLDSYCVLDLISQQSTRKNVKKMGAKTKRNFLILKELGLAQVGIDQNDFHQALHHLQKAQRLDDSSTLGAMAHFFTLCLMYLRHRSLDDGRFLAEKFSELPSNLPDYLHDQVSLFMQRLSILGVYHGPLNPPKNLHLKKLFERESQASPVLIRLFKKLTLLRIDLYDIYYLYEDLPWEKMNKLISKESI